MVTERDLAVLKFMQINTGKTFETVLEKTFFPSRSAAERFATKMIKDGILERKKLGIQSPKSMLVFAENAKEIIWEHFAQEPIRAKLSSSTVKHEIYQQICHFWIEKIGGIVERTNLKYHFGKMNHVPDLICKLNNFTYHIEIELTKKTLRRYQDIILNSSKDGPDYIVYVTQDDKMAANLAQTMPKFNRLFFVSADNLVENCKKFNMIGAKNQKTFCSLV